MSVFDNISHVDFGTMHSPIYQTNTSRNYYNLQFSFVIHLDIWSNSQFRLNKCQVRVILLIEIRPTSFVPRPFPPKCFHTVLNSHSMKQKWGRSLSCTPSREMRCPLEFMFALLQMHPFLSQNLLKWNL